MNGWLGRSRRRWGGLAMAGKWRVRTVSDLIDAGLLQIGDGYRARNIELAEHGIPFARAGNINGGFQFDDADHVPPAILARVGDKRSKPGDVVFTSKGSVGRFAQVDNRTEPFVFSPQLCFWRSADHQALDPRYLYAWFRGTECGRQIDLLKGQTDMADYVSLRDQRTMQVTLPPLAEQRAIASVLTALDDKIESNERLAQALTDVLMLAPPPAGTPIALDSIAAFRNGGALTKHATGTGRPILRIKELKAGVTDDTPRTDAMVRRDHEVEAGDLLFSWSGTLLTHRWSGPGAVLNQHIFRVDPAIGFPRWFVEAWIERHLSEFRSIAADKATTMGHIQRHHLAEAQVAVPGDATMRELRAAYDPLEEYRMTVLRESRTLTAIRDALLPKLVSGQIRVPLSDDPEEQLGAAAEGLEIAEGAA